MSEINESVPVDFNNPESIASELAAVESKAVDKKSTAKKPPKPRVIKVSYTAVADIKAGETVTFEYELPKSEGTRGALVGIELADMTDDQLKIEYRNANSVAYKTKKAGNDSTKADARLAKVKEAMEKRGIQPTARAADVNAKTVADLIVSGKITAMDIQKFLDEAASAKATADAE